MKVLISDKTSPVCRRALEGFTGVEVVEKPGLPAEQLLEEVGSCQALIVRSATKVTRQVLEAAGGLKVVGRAGAGVDNIDLAAARERGIVVMNTPGGNSGAVAELVIGLMFALARNIPQADASMKAGRWEKTAFMGRELSGKTLGLIGIGHVGATVARKASALGMRVLATDPYVAVEQAREMGATLVELEALYREGDYISLHVPRTAETAGLIDAGAFAAMKEGVRLVNCARGGIVVEADLLAALESGKVAGAALDVYESEPPADLTLAAHPRVVALPHIGASTQEAQEIVAEMIGEQVGRFLTTGEVVNAVGG